MSGLHPKRTLVPIDFSEISLEALDKAIEIAGGQYVELLNVAPPILVLDSSDIYGSPIEHHHQLAIEAQLKQLGADRNLTNFRARVALGDPGHEIVACAKREEMDLIVMSSHGYGFMKHMWMGSVAERVVRTATCPVLVLRH